MISDTSWDSSSHLNATAFLSYLAPVFSHTISIINHFRGKPEHSLAVFHMMCGRISPASIGLTEMKTVRSILSRTRLAFKIHQMASPVHTTITSIICLFSFGYSLSWLDLILFGEILFKCLFMKKNHCWKCYSMSIHQGSSIRISLIVNV